MSTSRLPSKKTKIVCTIGPASRSQEVLQQMIANGYEVSRGLRKKGQTKDAGFQIGVQRVMPVGQETLWDWLVESEGRRHWLGAMRRFALDKGATYRSREGIEGKIISAKRPERLRLTYEPAGARAPTTLQLTLSCPRNRFDRSTLRALAEPEGPRRNAGPLARCPRPHGGRARGVMEIRCVSQRLSGLNSRPRSSGRARSARRRVRRAGRAQAPGRGRSPARQDARKSTAMRVAFRNLGSRPRLTARSARADPRVARASAWSLADDSSSSVLASMAAR